MAMTTILAASVVLRPFAARQHAFFFCDPPGSCGPAKKVAFLREPFQQGNSYQPLNVITSSSYVDQESVGCHSI
ncbi:hypothetical protein HDV63DRAFT_387392, partial [Trichoderma sp. SZMC 28014]